jgi:hypothetical protein
MRERIIVASTRVVAAGSGTAVGSVRLLDAEPAAAARPKWERQIV